MTGKSRLLGALIVLCGLAVAPHPSPAQESGDGAAKGPLWSSRCTAVSRQTPVDCLIEQRAVITKTGQLLVQVTVRVPAETKKPVMMVQVPLGPFLPGGLVLDIDGKNNVKLDFQTCDANGCYAATPVSEDLLGALFAGHKLNVTVQALNKNPIQVPMDLAGFTAAYRNIQ